MNNNIVTVENLKKTYIIKKNLFSKKNIVKAVDDISFNIYKGEILGLIGESGSGKTTTGKLLLKLENSNKGTVYYNNVDINTIHEKNLRKLRKDYQIIFQHNYESLDPKMTIEELLIEPLRIHSIVKNSEYISEVDKLLNMVGLTKEYKYKFPYQLSGGQKQRVVIARAISTRPKFIVCDEPVSALDVSVQGQILNLLINLKKELNLTYLFISHDIKVIKYISDRIAVMYKGNLVEIGDKKEVLYYPKNEYTKKLISSMI